MKFSLFKYGSSTLYGSSLTFDSISPNRGPSTGGQDFVIRGSSFEFNTYDDEFDGVILDSSKWTDLSSGTGSTVVSDGCAYFSSGSTAGSIGGIEMKTSVNHIQYETRINIPYVSVYPSSGVSLFTFQLYIDANNNADMSVLMDSVGNITLECSVYRGGILVSTYSESWTAGVSTFKFLRWRDILYFYANGSLFFRSDHFTTLSGSLRFFVNNKSANYDVYNTTVDFIKHKTYAVFDEYVVNDLVTVSSDRVRGITPPSMDSKGQEAAYAGFITIHIVTNTVQSKSSEYEYYYVQRLVLLEDNQFGVKFSDISDSIVRTPELSNRGLGGKI